MTMLAKQGIVSEEDREAIIGGLKGILADIESGKLEFTKEHEDIISFVEANLIEAYWRCRKTAAHGPEPQ